MPLHGELEPKLQDAAVARYEQRKVVVATNVAETSLTIDGVRLVIDSGLARIARYDANRGINTLLIERFRSPPPTSAPGAPDGPRRAFACGFGRARNMTHRAAAGIAGNPTARSGGGGADAEGGRRGRFAEVPVAGKAG